MSIKKENFSSLLRGIQTRKLTAIARAVSILENNSNPLLKNRLKKYLTSKRRLSPFGKVIGITGPAGSGKSTLIGALAKLMRKDGKKVAIVAVDPTSPKTGGAFLGDRVRMQDLAEDPGVFIRSMASRGKLGGVARATEDVAKLFLKSGYEFVLVETVGAGQLDYEVAKFSDVTLLVLTPESGDEVQFMKAGLREVVSVFVINKADRSGANRLHDFLKSSQGKSEKGIPIFKTIAEQKKGTEALYEWIKKSKNRI